MAHELYQLADGTYSMLRAEDSEVEWHGLATPVPASAGFDGWANSPVFDWKLQRGVVRYNTDHQGTQRSMDSMHVIMRSDTKEALSVVSKDYHIVQPKQVLEFFRTFCEKNHLTMDTAGIIRRGLKFWSLARTGHQVSIGPSGKDTVKQFILLASSCDSSMATTAKHTSLRTVCSNTLHQSLGNGEAAFRVRHSRQFNETEVAVNLGLLEDDFNEFGRYANEMASTIMELSDAQRWLVELMSGKVGMVDEEIAEFINKSRSFRSMWESYTKAPGAQPTLWGAVNAVTHNVDWIKGRSMDTRFDSAQFGQGANLKAAAWAKAKAIIDGIKAANDALAIAAA